MEAAQVCQMLTFMAIPVQTVWIVDTITWTVLWPMIKQTSSGEINALGA